MPIQLIQLVIFIFRDGPSVLKATLKAAKEERIRVEQLKKEALLEEQRRKEEVRRILSAKLAG